MKRKKSKERQRKGIHELLVTSEDEEEEDQIEIKKKNTRKRAMCEDDDDECNEDEMDNEPPLKRRRVDEARSLIKRGGIVMFLKVLDGETSNDNESAKETLMN
eukprot:818609_1